VHHKTTAPQALAQREETMYAALVNLTIDPAQAPAAAAAFTGEVLPRLKSADGFVGGYWVDPVEGHGFGFVLFDTEEHARQAAAPASNWNAPGVTVLGVDIRRVAVAIP
jgi:hypothetical protein